MVTLRIVHPAAVVKPGLDRQVLTLAPAASQEVGAPCPGILDREVLRYQMGHCKDVGAPVAGVGAKPGIG
jgi:hypothetical protein